MIDGGEAVASFEEPFDEALDEAPSDTLPPGRDMLNIVGPIDKGEGAVLLVNIGG